MVPSDPSAHFRILVIDDNPAIHEDFKKILDPPAETPPTFSAARDRLFGVTPPDRPQVRFSLDSAHQGEEGVRMLQGAVRSGQPYALAFVDVRMPPGVDGVATIGLLWAASPGLQVVLCTAYSDYAWEDIVQKLGRADNLVILKKPFDNIEVLQLAYALTAKWQLNLDKQRSLEGLEELVRKRTAELLEANRELSREIEERALAAAELRASEARNRALLSAIPDLIIQYSPEGIYRSIEASDPGLLFMAAQQVLGRGVHEVLPGPVADAMCEGIRRALATRAIQEVQYSLPVHGRDLSFEARLAPCGSDSIIAIVRDVTEQKQAAEERRRLQERLIRTQALEALGVLVSGVAHNLNNVLAIIMGTASVREELSTGAEDREAYRTIGKVCVRGRDVVQSLIQFAQPPVANHTALEVHGLLRGLSVLLASTMRNRVGIVEAYADAPLWIEGEAGSLQQALMNLALNAVDAMPGGGTLTLRTAVVAGDQVEVAVQDDGAGMIPEVAARALEPFFTTKPVGKGTGLGLSMAYGVVKAHGGTIAIDSQPGLGTTVRLRFPRIPCSAQDGPRPSPAPAAPGKKIYVVDDDEDMCFLMARMLRQAGLDQVQTFSGGEAVLRKLEGEGRPDLIILDQNMPGLNGVQTMERIQAAHPGIPILVSSGEPAIEEWPCFRRPGVAVISKPFDLAEVRRKLAGFQAQA